MKTLSDKQMNGIPETKWYAEKDVKEAVKKLKETFYAQDFASDEAYEYSMQKIDKIFGDKLT